MYGVKLHQEVFRGSLEEIGREIVAQMFTTKKSRLQKELRYVDITPLRDGKCLD